MQDGKCGVMVVGSMNFDSFYLLPRKMRIGENLHATSFQTGLGGKGANQAVQCAKLGVPTTMVGCLGTDSYGDSILAGMSEYGIDMSLVRRVGVPTGNASVWTYPDGEVQAALYGGANMQVTKQQIDQALALMKGRRVVILQNEIPIEIVEYAATSAKGAGCFLIYNAAPALSVSLQTLALTDLLVVNESEASFYSHVMIGSITEAEKAATQLRSLVRGTVIITLGPLGSLVATAEEIRHIPAQKVRAVESTGAGDSYVGALAYGIVRKLPIWETVKIATRTASITVSSVGAQLSMPTLAQLMKRV